ncbi:S16 family serine protease [Nitrospira sp. M1]
MANRNISSTHRCSDFDSHLRKRETVFGRYILSLLLVFLFVGSYVEKADAQAVPPASMTKRSIIPILGTTYNEQWEQVGIVADVEVEFERRDDHEGLQLDFLTKPGRFSSLAKRSVQDALALVTQAAGLNADSWTVRFRLPYAGVTLYGESLSAMAAMSVVALAKGEMVHSDIVMTGTVTPEGSIGTVGGIPLKIVAAHQEHFRRVLIPEEPDVADGDWQTPFLMHVSPVKSVDVAYFALTDHPLKASGADQQIEVSLAR